MSIVSIDDQIIFLEPWLRHWLAEDARIGSNSYYATAILATLRRHAEALKAVEEQKKMTWSRYSEEAEREKEDELNRLHDAIVGPT